MEDCFTWLLLFAVCLTLVASSKEDCGKEQFPCLSSDQCVDKTAWCNGVTDCKDESDEAYCKKNGWFSSDPNKCWQKEESLILCGSGICIPIEAQCDGYKDCDDGYDEEGCTTYTTTTTTKMPKKQQSVDTSTLSHDWKENYSKEEDYITVEISTSVSEASFETSTSTSSYKKDEEVRSSSISNKQEVHAQYLPTSTSFYQKRLKEAGSETIPPPTFPKTVPTRSYLATRSTATSAPKSYHSTRTVSSTTAQAVTERRSTINIPNLPRSQSTYQPRIKPQQRSHRSQTHPTTSASYPQQPSSSRYQPHAYPQQPSSNRDQTSPVRYQPASYPHQPPSNHYQSPNYPQQSQSNRYQPRTEHQQPLSNHYQPPTYPHQSPSNHHQPSNHYQQSTYLSNRHQPSNYYQHSTHPSNRHQHYVDHQRPSYGNHKDPRPVNGEPDTRHNTNYFKPYGTEPHVKKLFYFSKDYASVYGRDNERSIKKGTEWLLGKLSDTQDWGRDSSRAVIALSLANNSFLNGDDNGEIIKRRFMIQLGTDLLRNNTENFSINRLAMAINGLMAICEDPTDFHGMDLTEMLRYKIRENNVRRNSRHLNPFLYLSLCLTGKDLSSSELQNLMKQMTHFVYGNERAKDMQSAAIMAFSCYLHQSSSEDLNYRTSLRSALRGAVVNLLEQMSENGDFGSVYSTALAAQALISTNESSNWNAVETMSFLKEQQREDGSFGDLLATYFALPVLSGRSLLHLRNKNCNPVKRELAPSEILEYAGPKQYVHYSIYFGYPVANTQSQYLLVPRGINFLDVMRAAEYQDQNFRFTLDDNNFNVHSLSGLPNDPEMGLSWHLYLKPESNSYSQEPNSREQFTGDIRSLFPKSEEHLIFWYHSNELSI